MKSFRLEEVQFFGVSLDRYKYFLANGDVGHDAFVVLMHLLFTAHFQKTNQPWATTEFLHKGTGLSISRVKKAKAFLKTSGFISYIQGKKDGFTEKFYTRINYFKDTGADSEPVNISLDRYKYFLANGDVGHDAFVVLMHLLFTAHFQKTNQPWATTEFLHKGTGLSISRVKKAKAFLKTSGFISYIQGKKDGFTEKFYTRINYFKDTGADSEPVTEHPSCESTKITGLENEPVTPKISSVVQNSLDTKITGSEIDDKCFKNELKCLKKEEEYSSSIFNKIIKNTNALLSANKIAIIVPNNKTTALFSSLFSELGMEKMMHLVELTAKKYRGKPTGFFICALETQECLPIERAADVKPVFTCPVCGTSSTDKDSCPKCKTEYNNFSEAQKIYKDALFCYAYSKDAHEKAIKAVIEHHHSEAEKAWDLWNSLPFMKRMPAVAS